MITEICIGLLLWVFFMIWMEVKARDKDEDERSLKRLTRIGARRMKQKLKGGDEFDCVSKWRKKGIISRKSGLWKKIKQKMNKRFRKEGKITLKSADISEGE